MLHLAQVIKLLMHMGLQVARTALHVLTCSRNSHGRYDVTFDLCHVFSLESLMDLAGLVCVCFWRN